MSAHDEFHRPQAPLGPLFAERPARTTGATVRAERKRRQSNRVALLDLLNSGGWHDLKALHAVGGWRYGARLHELRSEGAVIHRRSIGPGLYEWALDRGDPPTIYADRTCDGPCCGGAR